MIPTPRFCTSFKVAGTKSYRLAASKLLGKYGGNAQNPPPCVKRQLRARRGRKFVQPDQSGAEALLVANLAPPGRYRSLFAHNVKPHTFLALHLFADQYPEWFVDAAPYNHFLDAKEPSDLVKLPGWKLVDDRIKSTHDPYYIGKRTAHARSYKMGWVTFQRSVLKDSEGKLVLSAADAKRFLSGFDHLFPEISVWQDETVFLARKNRVLYNLFNYPREFHRIFTPSYEREIISWIPQSTVGCLSTEAILVLEKYIADNSLPWTLLNQKHDSILYEVPDADVEHAARRSVEAISSFELTGRDGVKFRMKSEVQVGSNWDEYHPTYNPEGMRKFKV